LIIKFCRIFDSISMKDAYEKEEKCWETSIGELG
jgi:hypothetical protein